MCHRPRWHPFGPEFDAVPRDRVRFVRFPLLADASGIGIDSVKRDLRLQAAERRRQALGNREAAAIAVRDRFLQTFDLAPAVAISAFWPLDDEFDPRPLFMELQRRGHPVGLPVVVRKGQPLLFRRWLPDIELVRGPFRVMIPPPGSPEIVPDLLLVPLLAFDRDGYRLGYGGGFYDRTLAGLRAGHAVTAIGVAFAGQEVDRVPRGAADQRLDWIITEEGALNIATARPNTDKS